MSDENKNETEVKTETEEKKEEVKEPKLLTEEEVNKRIEAARKQEKDKLYSKIDELGEKVHKLNASAEAEQTAKDKAEAEIKAKAETERQAKMSNDERFAESMRVFEERLAKEASERERLEAELREEREARELEVYRQEILTGETDIIPDLVGGKTKSDIDRSVARAKTRFQELFTVSREKAEGNKQRVGTQMPGPTDPNSPAIDEQELEKSIQNFQIDAQRYTRDPAYRREMDVKRAEVLDNVGQAYKRSVGR